MWGKVLRQRPILQKKPKTLTGLLDLFVNGESSPKFTIYSKQRLMMFCEKRNQDKLKYQKKIARKIHKSKTSIHKQREQEIERGHEEKIESSPMPTLPSPSFVIMKMLVSWLSFCVKVSSLRNKKKIKKIKNMTPYLQVDGEYLY